MSDRDRGRQHTTDAELEALTVGAPTRLDGQIHLAEPDPGWPNDFAAEEARIRAALGSAVRRLEHVGSTSVPGLAAKPILDMVMAVPDSSDEPTYALPLEHIGYTLRVREPEWFEHRMMKGTETEVNLHVFTGGCSEIDRMVAFRDHLRSHEPDRLLYERTKRELAGRHWCYLQNYADAKTEVVDRIMARPGAGPH